MRRPLLAAVLVALAVSGIWALVRTDRADAPEAASKEVAPLAFVPANSAYVFANLEPLPPDVQARWFEQLDRNARVWSLQLAQARRLLNLGSQATSSEALRWIDALQGEVGALPAQDLARAMGLGPDTQVAFYGVDLVPVLRLSLAEPEALQTLVSRIEERAGTRLARGRIDAIDYWQLVVDDLPVRGIAAVIGDHLVLTLAPRADDAPLRDLLGLRGPASSHANEEALRSVNAAHGLLDWGSGYLDTRRLLQALIAPPTAVQLSFARAAGAEPARPDPHCAAEIDAMAQVLPRVVAGYTHLDAQEVAVLARIELRADIARDLQSLRAGLPAGGFGEDAPLHLGIALRLSALPALVNRWAGAVAQSPWGCPALQPLNGTFAELRRQANHPALFAAAPVFHGLHAIVTRLVFAADETWPEAGGLLLISGDNPSTLFGMARAALPALALAEPQPDGPVLPLPPLDGVPISLPMFTALRPGVLGLAVGAGQDAVLLDAMRSDGTQQPLLVAGYSGATLAQLNRSLLQRAADALESGGDAEAAQEQRALAAAMAESHAALERAELRVHFSAQGIDLEQRLRLRSAAPN